MKAIRVHEYGDAGVMRLEDLPEPAPRTGEALVRIDAIGINYIDVYQRMGLYPVSLPFTPGGEAAGVVEAIGPGVRDVREGDRVAWQGVLGAYAEKAVVPADRLVRLPQGLDAAEGAAVMLQGMTAHYLACSTYPLRSGDACLVHAAAGGVGLLLVQIARARGARVIGTTSSPEKAALARDAGAHDVVGYTDFDAEVRKLTNGAGVSVVYDSVGRATFERSLASLMPRGMLVLFGQSSGPVPPFDPQVLNKRGSLYLTRPSLGHYVTTRAELLERANGVLEGVRGGALRLRIFRELPLALAAEAHRLLESRATTGKLLQLPGMTGSPGP